jgi:hypothetical protein
VAAVDATGGTAFMIGQVQDTGSGAAAAQRGTLAKGRGR